MATLTITNKIAETGSAPGSIPLWFVDETNGMWTEQGSAKKVGSNYIGEVSHFSYWDFGSPANYVNLQVTIVDQFNNPLPNYTTTIKEVGTTNEAYGYTNSVGFVTGAVPNNASLEILVYSPICGTFSSPIYTQTFNTTSLPLNLGTIQIALSPSSLATVNGTLVDCSNLSISNGYISYKPISGSISTLIQPNALGQFSAGIILCSNPTSYEFTGYDATTLVNGSQNISLVPGVNTIGNVNACGNLSDYLNFSLTINSVITNYSYTVAPDTINHTYYINPPNNQTTIYANNTNQQSTQFYFDGSDAILGNHNLIFFSYQDFFNNLNNVGSNIATPFPINLTQYGGIGQPVAGSFSGTFIDLQSSNNVLINCNFRVTRN